MIMKGCTNCQKIYDQNKKQCPRCHTTLSITLYHYADLEPIIPYTQKIIPITRREK